MPDGEPDGREASMGSLQGSRHSTISGFVLIAVGAWAALAPFLVGGWDWDTHSARFLLTVVPGGAAVIGGLIMLGRRPLFLLSGGILALAGGLWFIAAPLAYAIFVGPEIGTYQSGETIHVLQWVFYFVGAGAVVSVVSSYALGLIVPLEFEDEQSPQVATASPRARVPLPAEHPRRARGTTEPTSRRPASTKRSAKRDA
jgi:hypothetical protein